MIGCTYKLEDDLGSLFRIAKLFAGAFVAYGVERSKRHLVIFDARFGSIQGTAGPIGAECAWLNRSDFDPEVLQ